MAGLFERLMRRVITKSSSDISAEIVSVVDSAKEYMAQYRSTMEEITKQRHLLELMAHHMGGLVWIKRWDDENKVYLYEFANRTHCDLFFKFEPECLEDCTAHVSGKSDIDILNEFRERTRLKHTCGDLCISTDIHATEQAILHYETNGEKGATSCRYIECGYVGEKPLILEVVKTPLFNLNYPCKCWKTHTYTVGNAFDVSIFCDSRLAHAQDCVEKGQGEKLQNGVYYMYPEIEICRLAEKEFPKE